MASAFGPLRGRRANCQKGLPDMKQVTFAALACSALLAVAAAQIPQATADETLASGTFTGKSNHKTKGQVSVVKTDDGFQVVLEDSFWFDGAPDPKLGLGKNGYDATTQFSPLQANSGKQVYKLPATIDPAQYNEVWVWCESYSVPLGVAKLK